MASTAAPIAETQRLEISAAADAPATERLGPRRVRRAPVALRAVLRGFSWRTIAVSAVTVFVLALLFITAVELISGKPLSAIFGGADTGTTLKNLVNPSPAPDDHSDAHHLDHVDSTTTREFDHDDHERGDDDQHHGADRGGRPRRRRPALRRPPRQRGAGRV